MSFVIDLERFRDNVEEHLTEILKKIAFDLLRSVVLETPVDTGRARANWSVGRKNPSARIIADVGELSPGAAAQLAFDNAAATIEEVTIGEVVWINNNLEYIVYLEDGSSDQAPNGMVKITLRRYPGIVEKVAS